jgi:hypothetical protein
MNITPLTGVVGAQKQVNLCSGSLHNFKSLPACFEVGNCHFRFLKGSLSEEKSILFLLIGRLNICCEHYQLQAMAVLKHMAIVLSMKNP